MDAFRMSNALCQVSSCPYESWGLPLLFLSPFLFIAMILCWCSGHHHGYRLPSLTIGFCVFLSVGLALYFPSTPIQEGDDLWTILTLAVGLAAYTSTILMSLRGSITKVKQAKSNLEDKMCLAFLTRTKEKLTKQISNAKRDFEMHQEDHNWLTLADFLLALISLVIISVIVFDYFRESACYQALIGGLFMAVIPYFVILHGRQWNRHRERDRDDSRARPTSQT